MQGTERHLHETALRVAVGTYTGPAKNTVSREIRINTQKKSHSQQRWLLLLTGVEKRSEQIANYCYNPQHRNLGSFIQINQLMKPPNRFLPVLEKRRFLYSCLPHLSRCDKLQTWPSEWSSCSTHKREGPLRSGCRLPWNPLVVIIWLGILIFSQRFGKCFASVDYKSTSLWPAGRTVKLHLCFLTNSYWINSVIDSLRVFVRHVPCSALQNSFASH